jgi:hypothetical protein
MNWGFRMNFSQIILEPEQKELFIQIVETVKMIPRNQRMEMIVIPSMSKNITLIIPTKSHKQYRINHIIDGDLNFLANKGLLNVSYSRGGEEHYLVSPEGLLYYEWLMKEMGKPVERIEKIIFQYFEFEDFRKQYSAAYNKLKQAEELLWESDSDANFSIIGLHCREALQEFADVLYSRVLGKPSPDPKSSTVNRIREVIKAKREETGETVWAFLDVLLPFWGTVSDLTQRQTHAEEKEGEPINWEDARRVVFQTANVMFELHRTIGK